MTRQRIGILTAIATFGLALGARHRLKRRRRRLALLPVGICSGSGMTMRRSRRLAQLRVLATINHDAPRELHTFGRARDATLVATNPT